MNERKLVWERMAALHDEIQRLEKEIEALHSCVVWGIGVPFERARIAYERAHDGESPKTTEGLFLWTIHRAEEAEKRLKKLMEEKVSG